jgi:hypothetical protein
MNIYSEKQKFDRSQFYKERLAKIPSKGYLLRFHSQLYVLACLLLNYIEEADNQDVAYQNAIIHLQDTIEKFSCENGTKLWNGDQLLAKQRNLILEKMQNSVDAALYPKKQAEALKELEMLLLEAAELS